MNSTFAQRLRELESKHYLVIAIFIVIFFGAIYGIYNYRQEQMHPVEIEMTTPTSGVYDQDTIVIEGKTKPRTRVVVNGIETESDAEGNYYAEVDLIEGDNEIVVTAGEGREENTQTYIVTRSKKVAPIANDVDDHNGVETNFSLNNSGPETLWIPEILLLSGSALLYALSRKNVEQARN